ncbi:hypothetical protein LCGC14_1299510 [marine sediment metagenome]|uniref:Uncharacterized protein n=1 Tax=marine sediment metagenome TaxID=412755 RepID=A0A0F9N6L4_9ZZZZ
MTLEKLRKAAPNGLDKISAVDGGYEIAFHPDEERGLRSSATVILNLSPMEGGGWLAKSVLSTGLSTLDWTADARAYARAVEFMNLSGAKDLR